MLVSCHAIRLVANIGKDKAMEYYCCDSKTPSGMTVYYSHFGGNLVAECDSCTTIWGYWECACELVHDCQLVKG